MAPQDQEYSGCEKGRWAILMRFAGTRFAESLILAPWRTRPLLCRLLLFQYKAAHVGVAQLTSRTRAAMSHKEAEISPCGTLSSYA
jgi:hypothetical protein